MNAEINVTDKENDLVSAIPPFICNNPREKVAPEKVNISEILLQPEDKLISTKNEDEVIYDKPNLPVPRYPLTIEWSPNVMVFEIDESKICQKLRILNKCPRSVYIVLCGLWGEVARFGAKWRCLPRTRYILAPGLAADVLIQATPKEQSSIRGAQIAIQLAAAHKRDNVVAYFAVPLIVKFINYNNSYKGEEGDSSLS